MEGDLSPWCISVIQPPPPTQQSSQTALKSSPCSLLPPLTQFLHVTSLSIWNASVLFLPLGDCCSSFKTQLKAYPSRKHFLIPLLASFVFPLHLCSYHSTEEFCWDFISFTRISALATRSGIWQYAKLISARNIGWINKYNAMKIYNA